MLRRVPLIALASVIALVASAASGQIAVQRVASGLAWPVYVTAPPGDTERLFIVQQGGLIRIHKLGILLPEPFLDLSALVTAGLSQYSEQGLLGLAFHPDYALNGFFFVNYTDLSGDTVVARYRVQSGHPDRADAASGATVLTVAQPYANHNGGTLAFGPDGYLYIGMGDGGSGGDPGNRAQSDGQLLGKLLRIDVTSAFPYAIPPDNPFAGPGLPLDEIWAKGLRNPYRFSFDALTGDLYIGDVGQNEWEEIDFTPAGTTGGLNYGWRLMEGDACYDPPTGCNDGSLTLPVHVYGHNDGCSVTGGMVYRGGAIPAIQGHYFFADYCTARLRSFRMVNGAVTELTTWPVSVVPGNGPALVESISAIGSDGAGELYIVDRTGEQEGEIWKIVPSTTSPAQRRSLGGVKALYGR